MSDFGLFLQHQEDDDKQQNADINNGSSNVQSTSSNESKSSTSTLRSPLKTPTGEHRSSKKTRTKVDGSLDGAINDDEADDNDANIPVPVRTASTNVPPPLELPAGGHGMLSNLPEIVVSSIASYLPELSRALIVIATKQHHHLLDGINWEQLDFSVLGKDLAYKLCDEDVHNILTCIDAKRTVKKLNLAYLWGVSGIGLQPLWGTTVLERFDASMVPEFTSPVIEQKIQLSETILYPIILSLIDTTDASIGYVVLPKHWRSERSNLLVQFLRKFNAYLCNKGYNCLHCNKHHQSYFPWIHSQRDEPSYGVLNGVCYGCSGRFCYTCECEGTEEGRITLWDYCEVCEKEYCYKCQPFSYPNGEYPKCDLYSETRGIECKKKHCEGCSYRKCEQCIKSYCSRDCHDKAWNDISECRFCLKKRCSDCVHFSECAVDGCDRANCWECSDDTIESSVTYCECDATTCLEHITEFVLEDERCGKGKQDCLACRGRAFTKIFNEHKGLLAIESLGNGREQVIIKAANPSDELMSNEAISSDNGDNIDVAHDNPDSMHTAPDDLPEDFHCCFVCGSIIHQTKSEMFTCGDRSCPMFECGNYRCTRRFCKECCPLPLCQICNSGVCSASCKEKIDKWDFNNCQDCGRDLCAGECSAKDDFEGGFVCCDICNKVVTCWQCCPGEEGFDEVISGRRQLRQCCNGTRKGTFCVICLMNEAKKSVLAGDKDYCLHCKGLVLTPLLQEYESKTGKPYAPKRNKTNR